MVMVLTFGVMDLNMREHIVMPRKKDLDLWSIIMETPTKVRKIVFFRTFCVFVNKFFEGGWRNGKKSGSGVERWRNDETYEGEYDDGK